MLYTYETITWLTVYTSLMASRLAFKDVAAKNEIEKYTAQKFNILVCVMFNCFHFLNCEMSIARVRFYAIYYLHQRNSNGCKAIKESKNVFFVV